MATFEQHTQLAIFVVHFVDFENQMNHVDGMDFLNHADYMDCMNHVNCMDREQKL